MARPLRVEYAGARYHVMARGNQHRDIFKTQDDADLFVCCLGEVCERNGTRVHAWCLMSNHYHLLLETPQANLVNTMKWFQGTFTQRYNTRHKLVGHLFQGRYKSKIVDDSDSSYFRRVSEYIHLNPAAAGLLAKGELADYAWSSYPLYLMPRAQRPPWLVVQNVLHSSGLPADSPQVRSAFNSYMEMKHTLLKRQRLKGQTQADWKKMEEGWVHGSQEFRKRLMASLAADKKAATRRLVDLEQKRDWTEAGAEKILGRCLSHFKLDDDSLQKMPKSAPVKQLIAGLLRRHFPVSVQWVSDRLVMGHFTTVSRAMHFYDAPPEKWEREKRRILKFMG